MKIENRKPLITPEYRDLNIELHYRISSYGIGDRFAPYILELSAAIGARSVLDYGCGKGGMRYALLEAGAGLKVYEFDPAIPGKQEPHYADIVSCADVMEHVEPEFTESVVAELCQLARKAVFVCVSCISGSKLLADGRSAHINVQSPEWWERVFMAHGDFKRRPSPPHEYAAVWIKGK